MADMHSAQIGDLTQHDVAQNIYNISQSIDQVTNLLNDRLEGIDERLKSLERLEAQHGNERQAMTRLIITLANEANTVTDVHDLLERQIDGDRAERGQRRRYLDMMLSALIVLSVINVGIHVYRVFRRPAGGAAI
jgi:septal ring factor EnvC (AmiA/AmiB activator)